MKLNWLRAGCASIAECGEYTATTWKTDKYEWCWELRCNESGRHSAEERTGTREAAEAACEAWLDKHDKPVWHDATEWLSWAEWRGKRIYLRTEVHTTPGWAAYLHGERHIATLPSRDEAKAAAEKYVRERTK